MYCAHKTATLTQIQHTVPPPPPDFLIFRRLLLNHCKVSGKQRKLQFPPILGSKVDIEARN